MARRAIAIAALAAFLPVTSTACFGKFRLVRKVYRFNQTIDNDKWVQWFTFLVLVIVPVYKLAGLVDLLLANSLEFWTGENPISAQGETRTLHGENGEIAHVTFQPDRSVDLVFMDAEGNVEAFTVTREGDSLVARDTNGTLLARVGGTAEAPLLLERR